MFEKDNSLLGRLIAYGKSNMYPFHMPGHKRKIVDTFPNPFEIDITEIDGFDNLHHAEGILKASMEQSARIYGADKTYYLVNGSTCGILSAVCACVKPGEELLMARNCHKAAYHGVLLQNIKAHYVYPEYLDEFGIHGGIRAEDIASALDRHPGIKAVLIVSPTYEGVVSDVQAIADIAHRYHVPLIVDEAHGAHFPFAKHGFPKSAIGCGADIVIQSLHKTLPSFTQTAILHFNEGLVDMMSLERYLGIFQSSSPSYIFLAAVEKCIQYMDQTGRYEMEEYGEKLQAFYDRLKALKVLKIFSKADCKKSTVYDWDMSKVIVSTGNTDMSGDTLSEILRNQYHLEMEMSGPEYIIGMTTLMDTVEGLNRLADALLEIDKTLEEKKKISLLSELPLAVPVMSLAQAIHSNGRKTELYHSEGFVSKEFIYLYPPGIPILAPGERITKEILDRVKWYMEKGLSIQGLTDPIVSSIITVAEE